MRLGLVIYGDLETLSGGFLYDRMLVQHLRSRGDEVEVITVPWRPYGWGLLDNLSIGLVSRLANAPYDLLLQDELIHPSFFRRNYRLRQKAGYPIVSLVHHLRSCEGHPAWKNRLYRWVERRYLASVDAFICPSRATQADVENLVGAGRPALVAPPGGDRFRDLPASEQVVARASSEGPLRILFLGNLIARKGLHLLLDALAKVKRSDWRLTAAGSLIMDPEYVRSIRRRIAQEGLGFQVELAGPMEDEELSALLRTHQVLAVPSVYEGFGIVYLEGMGFGLPAIGSAAGGAREIITHGQNGFLIEPGDAAALSQHLENLMADRGLLLRLSLAARERFQAHPTWEDTTSAIRRFLESLLARP